MKLTDRLLKIADLVTKGKKIADIGTDHGYIPVYLLNKGHVDFAILADVNKGPLENARSEVRHNNLTDKVDLRLGSGIEVLNENEVDGISGDYIEAIDELTNIFILDSSGCTIDNNTSYMLIDINKSLKFSKINLTYDYNKFINKELKKEFPDKETILKLFYGINK